ncbi:MAG: hypothetical protein ACRD3O_17725 [Terriglobia bacterium]
MAKSFTIGRELDEYISRTKGDRSASERVNEMLLRTMREERYEKLEAEAEAFFTAVGDKERKAARALQSASIHSINRE